jgi:uncharacterized membrane protein YqjE
MSGEDSSSAPATSLLRSLVQLGGSLLATTLTRVDLLTTEVSENVERGVRILMWGFVAALSAVLALLLAGVTLIIWFWDTYRMGAAVGVTLLFAALAAVAAAVVRIRMRDKPRLLDATRSELRRDLAALRREP